ncbi:MAG: efflux RND transporter periplasmic adaptor subunit [Bacteroidetes bacterium]|nr:efflux RND transporter periplasmic adaptor subunit [Bacteroidota bacterium]
MNTEMKSLFALKNALPGAMLLLVGLFLGWLFFAGSGGNAEANGNTHVSESAGTIWTCSMHPNIRQTEPGQCPICAMDLIPLSADAAADDPGLLQMTPEAVAAANVQTTVVAKGMPYREIRMPGRIEADETRRAEITARVAGRIEQLYVNSTGQTVRKGAKLASIYSPELLAAQKELMEAAKMKGSNPAYYEAAKNKLRYWDFTPEQIAEMEKNASVRGTLDILAPQSGTVLARHVVTGDYVRQGQGMFALADLGRVWVQFDAYENDLAWLRTGMPVVFTVAGQSGVEQHGSIAFIDPVINAMSRVTRVRVEMPNPAGALKPEMFATGTVKSVLPGKHEALLVPRSAVLWTGERSVVWVKDNSSASPAFSYREIMLGAEAGDSYVVVEGLSEGEEIVSNGAFSVDAAAQLQGKNSMMNPAGGKTAMGHDHAGANPAAHEQHGTAQSIDAPEEFRAQLRKVFERYSALTKSLVASDPTAAGKAGKAVRSALGDVDASLLPESVRPEWAEIAASLAKSIDALAATRDLEKQRAYFSGLSNTFYSALKIFGAGEGTIYWQHCPMAFDDKGANWLSPQKEIRNPYFGDKMLTCGVVKEELNGR